MISHEILGGAEPEEIAAALAPFVGLDVDVVVTARDLGRQATAHWQEEVKLGDTRSFADFEREQFRADVPRDASGERPHFWHAQDYAAALRRWSTALPAERVHLVVCPPPGAAPDLLWHRFADACGIPRRRRRRRPDGRRARQQSLTTEAIAVLRSAQRRARGSDHAPRARALRQARAGGGHGWPGRPGTPPRTPVVARRRPVPEPSRVAAGDRVGRPSGAR